MYTCVYVNKSRNIDREVKEERNDEWQRNKQRKERRNESIVRFLISDGLKLQKKKDKSFADSLPLCRKLPLRVEICKN